MNKKIKTVLLVAILVAATFFRFWKLDSIPPGLYPDVAMNGTDVLQSLKTGHLELFYPNNNGREGLFFWLIAVSFKIFGISIWSLKFPGALVGVLTVLGIYLLTHELLKLISIKYLSENKEKIALLSSFLLAASFWHTNFSRLGFRAIMLPFVSVFSFYFLFKGLREKRLCNFIFSGIIFGAGFYTYTSFRVAPAILIFLFFFYFFIFLKEKQFKKYFLFTASFFLSIFIVTLPLGLYFLNHKQDFISRAAPISVFAAANPLEALLKSLVLHLGMFNFFGDPNWRHNFAGHPMLPIPLGILFLVGLVYTIIKILQSLKNKRIFNNDFIIFGFLMVYWLVMLLPGILTYEGLPHALRTVGTIPPVYILTAIGGWLLYEKIKNIVKKQKLIMAATFIVLALVSASEFHKYFYLWAKNPNVAGAFTVDYANIGNYLNSLPDDVQKFVVVNEPGSPFYGISIAAQTPMFIEATKYGEPRAKYVTFESLDAFTFFWENVVIVPLYREKTLPALSEKFPQGRIEQINDFWVFKISK